MRRHETVSASVVLVSAEVNMVIYHLDPDRMIEAEMHRRRSLENEGAFSDRFRYVFSEVRA